MTRTEPDKDEMIEWASGLRNCQMIIAYEWANWAYWYLGFDDPAFTSGDLVVNEALCKLTEACRLRLRELADE